MQKLVDLHTFSTAVSPAELRQLEAQLSPAELGRAGRFQFEADRARYVVSRGMLRTILAGYLEQSPDAVPLVAGIHGKPVIRAEERRGLHFNLSRARDLCVVVVGEGPELGVDIEAVRPLEDALAIAQSRFTPAEAASITSPESFFVLWTRKEAVVKCLGWGLSLPFDVFEVAARVGVEPERVVVDYQGEHSVQWLQPIDIEDPGYRAAIANSGEEPVVLQRA